MKSKKVRLSLLIILATLFIVIISLVFIRICAPKYNYTKINKALGISDWVDDYTPYADFESRIMREHLFFSPIVYLNLYNDELVEKGKPLEDALSLDEVRDFYSSENDKTGNIRIKSLPKKLEDYVDWYYGFYGIFGGIKNYDTITIVQEQYLTSSAMGLGFYSERKNTQNISDAVIDDPINFYINIYVYNKKNPSKTITEDEVKMALVGGSKNPLILFSNWYCTSMGEDSVNSFCLGMYQAYPSYLIEHPDAPEISEMDLNEIQQLIEYMESIEE